MPTPRVLMSKIRQTLHLLADSGLSMRQVAAALGISKTTVSDIAMYARDAGVDWALASTLLLPEGLQSLASTIVSRLLPRLAHLALQRGGVHPIDKARHASHASRIIAAARIALVRATYISLR